MQHGKTVGLVKGFEIIVRVNKLKAYPKGSVLFVNDFLDYGNSESVKKALLRLKEKEILVRLAHGIYFYPRVDQELGVLFPSTEEIAKAIARRDKARIVPTGVQALNKLGLSTQVPMKVVYLTDGAARTVKVGRRTITFKKASPKNLLAKGEISGLAIQAIKTIGQNNLDEKTVEKIQAILKNEKKENISHDAKLSPAWINKILMQAREQEKQIDWLRAKLIKAEQSGFTTMSPAEILAQSKQELGI